MYKILLLDQSAVDLQISSEILVSGLRTVQVLGVTSIERAITVLEREAINLVIIDMPWINHLIRDLLRLARMHHPGISVLLTSVMREEEIAHFVMKVNANDYLLKPFRPAQLLAAVSPLLLAAVAEEEKAGLAEQREFLQRLDLAIKEFSYQQAMEIIKEYLDFLYQSTENMAMIRARIVEFAEGLASMKEDLGSDLQWRLSGSLERFRSRFDLQGNKYQACVILEGMMDAIFEAMERQSLYADDALKKVLNYIDRNVKKGIKLDDAAEYVNMSSSYFSKFFKKGSGMNFIDYITWRKIECAKEMLIYSDMPVSNVAYELSFNETNYFSKAFKKKVGLTPSEFRALASGQTPPKGS